MVLDPQAHKETENCSGELQQINAFSCPKFDFKNIKYRPKTAKRWVDGATEHKRCVGGGWTLALRGDWMLETGC